MQRKYILILLIGALIATGTGVQEYTLLSNSEVSEYTIERNNRFDYVEANGDFSLILVKYAGDDDLLCKIEEENVSVPIMVNNLLGDTRKDFDDDDIIDFDLVININGIQLDTKTFSVAGDTNTEVIVENITIVFKFAERVYFEVVTDYSLEVKTQITSDIVTVVLIYLACIFVVMLGSEFSYILKDKLYSCQNKLRREREKIKRLEEHCSDKCNKCEYYLAYKNK